MESHGKSLFSHWPQVLGLWGTTRWKSSFANLWFLDTDVSGQQTAGHTMIKRQKESRSFQINNDQYIYIYIMVTISPSPGLAYREAVWWPDRSDRLDRLKWLKMKVKRLVMMSIRGSILVKNERLLYLKTPWIQHDEHSRAAAVLVPLSLPCWTCRSTVVFEPHSLWFVQDLFSDLMFDKVWQRDWLVVHAVIPNCCTIIISWSASSPALWQHVAQTFNHQWRCRFKSSHQS